MQHVTFVGGAPTAIAFDGTRVWVANNTTNDVTRISTFVLANEGSNRSYRFLDVPEGHHELSHHGGDAAKHAKIRTINRFHVEQLAYLLGQLKSAPEGLSVNA